MNVKNVLKRACDFIGLDDIRSAIEDNDATEAQTAVINKLLKYFNRVQEEIATEFCPVSYSESISAKDSLQFSTLTKTILSVVSVKDGSGERLIYKLFPDHITYKGTAKEIVYSYIPEDVAITEDILYLVPLRVYGYGIAREYYLTEGLTDKAISFENRFKNSINTLMRKDNTTRMPARKWL